MDFKSQFKGASMAAQKDVQKDAAEKNKNSYSGGGRAEFFDVKEGKNEFRILPPHPESKISVAYLPKRVTMLKCEVEKYENGEPTGEKEIRNKNIFIATQHGGLPADPVELYIDFVRKYAEETIPEKDKRSTFLNPITGWSDKKGWNWGIAPRTTFVAYAVQAGKIGRLELYESWLKQMNKLAIDEGADEEIKVDPFSDPFEGFPLFITKGKNDKGKTEYTISKDEPSRANRETWDQFFKRTEVPEAILAEFLKQDPLPKLYGDDVYTKRDWDLAIDGLRRFDQEHKYHIFDNDDFIEKIHELSLLVPEPKESPKKAEEKQSQQLEQEMNNPAAQQTESGISIKEMKDELRRFIRKQYGEEYEDLIPFAKKDVEKWYSLMEEGEDLPIAKKQEEPTPARIPSREPVVAPEPEKKVEKLEESRPTPVEKTGSVTENDKVAEQIRLLRERRGIK